MDELKTVMNEHMDKVQEILEKVSSDLRIGMQPAIDNFVGFFHAIDWKVGADIPAESFKMSPVDRIFVRMGAKDHIMAGQSTFLTELLETSIYAGLPDEVLQKVATKSEEFEMMYGNKKHSKPTNQSWEDEMVQNLRNCLVDTRCGSSANTE